ncbi:helix-turn-helix domain-containing protein [Sphingobacterium chuzhouense]|uniref:AraC family transcriptional regulator n=1 Tax=Sphingobacterium chuzhouense TaxID=1742264 RepID=A0ABR7XLR6_9SPHI|nr:helix-turn-helix domain-containing protein [Sphingobacterium chuzhouense]MBD1420116.1 AraC family transcriptional regulator [Sphingobacterium chuzhouense]
MNTWELLTGEQIHTRIGHNDWEKLPYNLVFEFYLDAKGVTNRDHITLFLNYQLEDFPYNDSSYYLFVEKQLLRSATEIDMLISEEQPLSIKINDLDRSYIFHLIKMLLKNGQLRNSELSQQFVSNIAEQLLLLIMVNKNADTPQIKLTPVNRYSLIALNFVDYIKQEIRDHKTVHYYADRLGVTEKTLSKATRITLKITPKDLIQKVLADEAMNLLQYTDKTVKEIGYELGIDEINNFSSFFKKMTDMTPTEYRKLKKRESHLSN